MLLDSQLFYPNLAAQENQRKKEAVQKEQVFLFGQP